MKNITHLCLLALLFCFSSCSYLDILPDERAKEEDTYKDVEAARRFLYSCYGYMPNPNDAVSSLDFMTGDEVVTSFEHETFANFPKGNFTPAAPQISYWNTLYGGIRQSYKLLSHLNDVPGIEPYKEDYTAQLHFLIAYYHMLLFRCYGPIIIVKEEIDVNTDPSSYLGRSTLEESVNFICSEFDLAINNQSLPDKRNGQDVGLATRPAALALKAYTLMYYASPIFNGNSTLAEKLKNTDGSDLIPPTYDASRWEKARDAYKAAIDASLAAGYSLFNSEVQPMENKYPENKRLRILRANLCTPIKYNPEEIWTKNYDEGPYGLQKKSMPFIDQQNYNGVAPTMHIIRRFYTKNGLPYNVDPLTKDKNEFEVVTLNEENAKIKFSDGSEAVIAQSGKKTSQINLNREPRYYAWISFHNGFYEVTNASYNAGYNEMIDNQELVTNFLKTGNCGRKERNNNYSPTGFLNKKGVNPDNQCAKGSINLHKYPWPLVRLTELYLGYAECLAECGDTEEAKAALNPIRERAGIPSVDESWKMVNITPDAKKMVEIVRQERQIEMYLENQNFWDMRRWLMANQYFNKKHTGMNITATTIEQFSVETEVPFIRTFRDFHWLLPIPSSDINNNHNVVQNPGY